MHWRGLRGLVSLLGALGVLGLLAVGQALASGVTNSGDDLRDGWYPEQSSLTPQLVSGGSFGQLFSTSVSGQVYAQPLVSNGTLLVATENNMVYGLSPTTGAPLWPAVSLGTPWRAADIGCGDLAPTIGVTATPVIDPSTNTAYMTHKTYASGTSGTARWYLDAINLANGTERAGFPVALGGTAQNQPGQTFQPTTELQRPGLLLMNGVVYAAFGSSCDISPWQGWVFGVSSAGEVKARWVAVPSGSGAGIWQSGAGLTSDGPGSLLISTGNGGAPTTPTPGNPPPASLGESIIRLAVQPDGSLKAVDFFAPFDAPQLDSWDADFASGGVTGLNDQYFGTPSIPKLAVAVGKDGYVYLLNRESLGGFQQGAGGGDKVVQRVGPYGGVWARPGVWPGEGGWVYIPTASGGKSGGGSSGYLNVFQYGVSGTGQPTLSLQGTSSDAFGFSSSAPVVTSNGTTPGSALVWMVWTPNSSGAGAQLRAYDPVPVEGKPVLRWSAPVGTSAKFATPGVAAGRLYVGTREGKVLAFGSPVTPLLTGPATSFPTTTISNTAQKTLTLTATNTLTLTGLTSSSSQFTVGTPSVALPAQLTAGQTIQIPLTFAPTQTGLIGGTLAAETNQGTVSFALSGTGQAASAQLTSTPPLLSFGGTAVGSELSATATFRNVGGAPLTINAVKLPTAPYSASGAPLVGSTIAAGASLTIGVTFAPKEVGNFTGSIGLETTGGNATVGLSGNAAPPGVLQIKSEQNPFGSIEVGKSATQSFTVTNTGGTAVTVTKSKPPSGGAFAATTTLAEGTTIAPGETLTETVAFTPTAAGYTSGTWLLNGTDTTGLHEVAFNGTGTLPPPPSDTVLPSITGTVQQGQTLTGHSGSWTNEPTSYAYAWERCDIHGASCLPISGAGAQTYTLGSADVGATVRVVVIASNAGGPSTPASSAPSTVVPASATFGTTTVGGSLDTFVNERKRANRYALPAGGSLTKLSVYLAPTGVPGAQVLKGILYADAGGAPGALLGVSAELSFQSTSPAGWYDLPFATPVSLSAGNYWIGVITGATAKVAGFRFESVAGARVYNANTYSSGPTNPFGAFTTDAEQTSLYATYTPSAPISPPVEKSPPTITGTAQQGQTLSELHGSWTNEPTGYTYQWLQCESLGSGCLPISGATTQSYRPTAADVGHTLEVQETASNAGGPSTPASSALTLAVTGPPAPVNTVLPGITGTPAQGQTLNAVNGSWTNEPTSFAYAWERCDAAGANCSSTGVAGSSYPLGSADVGSTLRVAVTASNPGGPSTPAISTQSAVVQAAAGIFGKTTVGGASDTFVAERKRGNQYALGVPGTVTKLTVYLAPTGIAGQQLLKGVIYADSAGAPGALLGVSEQLSFQSTSTAGWYDLAFSTPVKLAAGTYWIGVMSGPASKVAGFRFDSVTGSRAYNTNNYGSGARNPFGAAKTDAEQTSLYATYTPG